MRLLLQYDGFNGQIFLDISRNIVGFSCHNKPRKKATSFLFAAVLLVFMLSSMLSRTLFQRGLSLATRSCSKEVLVKFAVPTILPSNQHRSIMTIVSEEDDEADEDAELSIFAHKSVHMGSEPYPGYKRVS